MTKLTITKLILVNISVLLLSSCGNSHITDIKSIPQLSFPSTPTLAATNTLEDASEVGKNIFINQRFAVKSEYSGKDINLPFLSKNIVDIVTKKLYSLEIPNSQQKDIYLDYECYKGGWINFLGKISKEKGGYMNAKFKNCQEIYGSEEIAIRGEVYIELKDYDFKANAYKDITVAVKGKDSWRTLDIKQPIDPIMALVGSRFKLINNYDGSGNLKNTILTTTMAVTPYVNIYENKTYTSMAEFNISELIRKGKKVHGLRNAVFEFTYNNNQIKSVRQISGMLMLYIDNFKGYAEYSKEYNKSQKPFTYDSNNKLLPGGESIYTTQNNARIKITSENDNGVPKIKASIDEDNDGIYESSTFI